MKSGSNLLSSGKFGGDEIPLPDEVLKRAENRKRILFVDDQVINHIMLLGYLQIRVPKYSTELSTQKMLVLDSLPNDITLYMATSGLIGIELFKKYKPDLIITDYLLSQNPAEGIQGDEMLTTIHHLTKECDENAPAYMMCSTEPIEDLETKVMPPLTEAGIDCLLLGGGQAKFLLRAMLNKQPTVNQDAPKNTL